MVAQVDASVSRFETEGMNPKNYLSVNRRSVKKNISLESVSNSDSN